MWFQNADFSKIRVLVVGDLMLDQYWDGATVRISPEAPVPVVNVADINNRLGGAGNVANNLAVLGATVTLLAYVGKDDSADLVLQLLKERKINHHVLKLDGYPTIKKLRILSRNQQLIRLDTEKVFAKIDQTKLLDHFTQAINDSDVVILSDYAKGTILDPQAFIQIAKSKHIPVIVDPKRDFAAYRNANVVTPNFKELQDVVGICHTERDIVKKGRALMKANNFEALIITRGSDGMTVIPADAPDIHLPACSGEVYDVTGAGDTVVAAIAVALAKKVKTIDAARFANLAASIVVGKIGTSTVSLSELQKTAFQTAYPFPMGIMQEVELCNIIRLAQSKGERIVFTNGCYDILHYGHVRYLEQAKSFGDRLIVGVNDDTSVSRLKGSARPINPVEQRMAVLAGLKAVDWVIPFTENTPGRLVEALSPDIIVKTDEHFKTIEDIPDSEGVQHVLAKGGKVYLIPRTPNISSTDIAIIDGQLN
jgi:D-beta-D-heptose 7-phosphate kinase/D-beta-D-heptose 1-phosphate adenosyltransferase